MFMSFIKYTRAPKIAAALHADSGTIFKSIPQQIPPLSMGTRGEGNKAAAMEAYQEDRVLIAKV